MVASVRIVNAGLVAVVALTALQGCSGDHPVVSPTVSASSGAGLGDAPSPSESASASGSPASSGSPAATKPPAAAGGAPLSGGRQIYVVPLDKGQEVTDSVLAVTSGGRVQVAKDHGDPALFVPTPTSRGGKDYLIKTGKLRQGGEPSCLTVRGNGSKPLTVVTAACDAAAATQLFTFDPHGKDRQGRVTYGIRNRDAFLQWRRTGGYGLIAEELGDSPLETTFVLVDRGSSTVVID
jgi:hypothetical protein